MKCKKSRYSNLAILFHNCLDRGCTPEQLQDFIDRARLQHCDNPETLRIIDDLEVRYITSMDLPEGVTT